MDDFEFRPLIEGIVGSHASRVAQNQSFLTATVDPLIPKAVFGPRVQVSAFFQELLGVCAGRTSKGEIFLKVSLSEREPEGIRLRIAVILHGSVRLDGFTAELEVLEKRTGSFVKHLELHADEEGYKLGGMLFLEAAKEQPQYQGRARLWNKRVLLLSKNDWMLLRLGEQLSLRGLVPQAVRSVEEARAILEINKAGGKGFDVVVVDPEASDLQPLIPEMAPNTPLINLHGGSDAKWLSQSGLYESIASALENTASRAA